MKDYFWCGNVVCGFHGERRCENQDGTSVAVCPLCGERATVIIGARTPPPQYVALRDTLMQKSGLYADEQWCACGHMLAYGGCARSDCCFRDHYIATMKREVADGLRDKLPVGIEDV